MIDKRIFDRIFLEAVDQLRKVAPVDTGNLRDSIKYQWINDHEFEIYVNVGDTNAFRESQHYDIGQAPYMPFVNEEWISPRWNGAKNPNQDWWNKAIENVIKFIAKRLGGKLE